MDRGPTRITAVSKNLFLDQKPARYSISVFIGLVTGGNYATPTSSRRYISADRTTAVPELRISNVSFAHRANRQSRSGSADFRMREVRLRGNRNRPISVVRVRHATDNAPPKRTLIVGSGGLPYSLRQYTIPRYNEPDFASALYRRKGGRHGRYSFGRGRGPSA